jgi:ABC-type transporter Mla maintaining outer membrane lipid asymmetry ATPase subunit MlaF
MKRVSIEKIAFNNLSYRYGLAESILENVTIEFPKNIPLVIQGPIGSGRSTLLKILIGLNAPTDGDYLINDEIVSDYSYADFDPIRLNFGITQELPGLLSNMSLFENLRLPLDFHTQLSTFEKNEYIESLFKLFDLQNQMHVRPMFTTAGTRKVIGLIRAFILKPHVLLLNNPTQSLHIEHIPILLELMKNHQKFHELKYIFIVSDDDHFYQNIPHKILNLADKKITLKERIKQANHEI